MGTEQIQPSRAVGRPTKLSARVHDTVVERVRAGTTLEGAAAAAGVSRSTLHSWLDRGRRALAALDGDEEVSARDVPYVELVRDVEQAEGEAETAAVAGILEAGERHWAALAWWLERRHPARWGRTRTDPPRERPWEQGSQDASRVAAQLQLLSPEERLRLLLEVVAGESSTAVAADLARGRELRVHAETPLALDAGSDDQETSP